MTFPRTGDSRISGEEEGHMPKVRVAGFGVSLDGFSAGTEQSLNDPLGKGGPEIFQWFFHKDILHDARAGGWIYRCGR
jgi:hypothetical protein